jgi:hypothetical protein
LFRLVVNNLIKGVVGFMLNTDNLTLEELDRRIIHFENRLMDFIITEDQIEFIREMLRDLKSAKARKSSSTF